MDYLRLKKGSSLGFASGFVAGLATVTPTAGFVGPMSAILIGVAAGSVCYAGVLAKEHFQYDDTLDVFGVHGVGGVTGTVLLGVFASLAWNADGANGLLAGSPAFLGKQALAAGVAVVYSVVMTYTIVKLVEMTMGIRVSREVEGEGLDISLHGEAAYTDGTFHESRARA